MNQVTKRPSRSSAATTLPGPLPSTMTAITQDRYGDSSVLRLSSVAVPTPEADEVLIRVTAAGVDRGTEHLVTGTPYLVRALFGLRRPRQPIPGLDVSGTVVSIGAAVTRFRPGDKVIGIANGSWVEYTTAKESKLTRRPKAMAAAVSAVEAAALPVSGSTALQAVVNHGKVRAGQQVLILGASGGVGSYAVQVAKARGAVVTGVASTRKLDMVRSLGADHVIDYRTTDPVDGSTRYDVIIDIGGRNRLSKLRRSLADSGTLVIVGGEGGGKLAGGFGRQLLAATLSVFVSQRLVFFVASEQHEDLDKLIELVEAGLVRPRIDRTYRLSQAPDALADLGAGRIAGKAVIDVARTSSNPNEMKEQESRS